MNANPNQWMGNTPISELEIKYRLENMQCLVKLNHDEDVIDQVKRYIQIDRITAKRILTRREMYFPLIDKLLLENSLPTELKYLTAIESAISPGVKSYAGAAGMWQFMPATAKIRGLSITDKVDERLDVIKSTIAAIDYLKSLYSIFGDWALVLAAYNCGENKVLDLIEKTGSRDFWVIRKDLPRQTQLFVPAFIGVTYLMNFYGEHDLIPSTEEMADSKVLTHARVFKTIDLKKMCKQTGIDFSIVEDYNPAYKKNIVPEKTNGMFITLPDTLMVKFVDYYIHEIDPPIIETNTLDSTIESITTPRIDIISFYRPYQFLPADIQSVEFKALDFDFLKFGDITSTPSLKSDEWLKSIYHIVKSRETLQFISDIYDNVSVDNILKWNNLSKDENILPGKILVIHL